MIELVIVFLIGAIAGWVGRGAAMGNRETKINEVTRVARKF